MLVRVSFLLPLSRLGKEKDAQMCFERERSLAPAQGRLSLGKEGGNDPAAGIAEG